MSLSHASQVSFWFLSGAGQNTERPDHVKSDQHDEAYPQGQTSQSHTNLLNLQLVYHCVCEYMFFYPDGDLNLNAHRLKGTRVTERERAIRWCVFV